MEEALITHLTNVLALHLVSNSTSQEDTYKVIITTENNKRIVAELEIFYMINKKNRVPTKIVKRS